MSVTLVATPGAANANSYLTLLEAQAYWDSRLFTSSWDDADDQTVALLWATRTMDALLSGYNEYFSTDGSQKAYIRTYPAWTGLPATSAQSLAWPRTGMLDRNGYPIADVAISGVSVASPAVVTTATPHRLTTGGEVYVAGSDSTPSIDGARVVTVLTPTTFSVAVNVTVAGTTGTATILPQALKDATAELAGAMAKADRTLDNDVVVQGLTSLRAGPVSLSFKTSGLSGMMKTLPDMVYALLVPSWITDDIMEPAIRAELTII